MHKKHINDMNMIWQCCFWQRFCMIKSCSPSEAKVASLQTKMFQWIVFASVRKWKILPQKISNNFLQLT